MTEIFISYSRSDLKIAEKIIDALAKDDLTPWIDWKSIPKGEEFYNEIKHGIEAANVFLFLVSPASVQSDWCNKEIAYAIQNGKKVLPIVIRDTSAASVNPEISKRNWIFCRDGQDDFDIAIGEMLKTIHQDYEWSKYHTKLLIRTVNWELQRDNSRLLRGKELRDAEKQIRFNQTKEPTPTSQQLEYIKKSRYVEVSRISILAITSIVAITLVAFFARNSIRQTGIAEKNALEVTKQAAVSKANQIAAQAQSLAPLGGQKSMIAVLLAIKSMQISPSQEATQIIQNNPYGHMLFETNLGEESIRSLTFSPDGRYLMASTDNETRIVDITDKKDVANLEGGHAVVNQNWRYVATISVDSGLCIWAIGDYEKSICVKHNPIINETDSEVIFTAAFSKNGDYVVTGGERTARVWDSSTGQEISYITHEKSVGTVAFSPDEKYVISGSLDGTARVWESATGREVSRMTHSEFVNCVAFSPDGRYVVSGGIGGVAIVWNPMNGSQITRVNHEGDVSFLTFTTDSEYVISSDFYTSRVWDAETGEKLAQIGSSSNNGFEAIPALGSDGGYIILDNSINGESTGIIWDAKTGNEIKRFLPSDAGGDISTGAISPDRQLIASGSHDGVIRVWTIEGSSNEVSQFKHYSSINDVVFSPDGKFLATADDGRTAHIWEIKSKTEITTINGFKGNVRGGMRKVLFSPDGKYLAFLEFGNIIEVWEVATNTKIAQITIGNEDEYVFSFDFSPDGNTIAYPIAGDRSKGIVKFWDFKADNETADFEYDYGVGDVVFSPNGKFIAVETGGVNVYVTEISTGETVFETSDADNGIHSIGFDPTSKLLAIGGAPMRVWDFASGKEISTMVVDSSIRSTEFINFNSDGSKVLSIGDGIIRVWETLTGKEIFQMNADSVTSATFSPDDRYIATGGMDGTARIWGWQNEDLLANPCYFVTRNLTKEEWKRYVGDDLPYEAICPDFPIEK